MTKANLFDIMFATILTTAMNNLKKIANQKGMKAEDIAAHMRVRGCPVTPVAVRAWLAGQAFSTKYLPTLCKTLEIEPNDIFLDINANK